MQIIHRFYQGPQFDYSNNFYWAPVNYVGVKLSIPITGSFKNTNSVKEYKLKMAQTDFTPESRKLQIYSTKYRNPLPGSIMPGKTWRLQKNNYLLSQKVYELKKQQYDSGSFSYEKLLDTEKSLSATEQEYISSVYSYLIAKINFQKAVGNY